MMAKTSRSSALTGSMLTSGKNGVTLELNAFHKVCILLMYMCNGLMKLTEPDEEPEEEDPAKLNMKPIPVHLDEAGFPELPPTTSMDTNKTKIVQSMLREYCTAHIRELYINLFIECAKIYEQGFITGHKNQVISWGSLAMDPSSWIDRECTPDGFVWKDPSKIRIGEIHRLLDHWRDRIDRGLIGLVWVPTCPLFQDQVNAPSHRRRFRQAMGVPQDDSDDEVFILPQSDEIEQEESGSNDDEQHSYRTSQVPSDVGQHSAIPTGYPHASMSGQSLNDMLFYTCG
jgi:hypothetical protein